MFHWSPPFLPARVTRWQTVLAAFLSSRVAGSFNTLQYIFAEMLEIPRLAENRSGRRQVVVVIRERALSGTSLGGTLPAVFASEDAAASFIRARVDRAS